MHAARLRHSGVSRGAAHPSARTRARRLGARCGSAGAGGARAGARSGSGPGSGDRRRAGDGSHRRHHVGGPQLRDRQRRGPQAERFARTGGEQHARTHCRRTAAVCGFDAGNGDCPGHLLRRRSLHRVGEAQRRRRRTGTGIRADDCVRAPQRSR